MRSMGPAENAMLRAFGSNPTTMAFGDVPPALETKVIDGLLTSLGGWNKVKEQAPFYSIAGINGIVGDYYYIAGSNKWWKKLKPEHQKIIQRDPGQGSAALGKARQLLQRQAPDRQVRHEGSVEAGHLHHVVRRNRRLWPRSWVTRPRTGSRRTRRRKPTSGSTSSRKKPRRRSPANPMGSNWLEKTDCAKLEPIFAKYTKK